MRLLDRLRLTILNPIVWRAHAQPLLCCVGSAAALRLCFPPQEWGWLAYVAMSPFLITLYDRTALRGALYGFVFGAVYFYLNLTWLNTLYDVNPLVPVGVFFLAMFCALVPAVFAYFATALLARTGKYRFLALPAFWVVLEYARSLGGLGFPWMYLGHTQVNHLTLIQICDLTGVYGPSFLIVLANMAIAETWRYRVQDIGRLRNVLVCWSVVALLFAATLIYGARCLREGDREAAEREKEGQFLWVALVQPGVPQGRKLASYMHPDPEQRMLLQDAMNHAIERQLTQIVAERRNAGEPFPQFYVLPESAVTFPFFNLSAKLTEMVEEWSENIDAAILLGANRFKPRHEELNPNEPIWDQGNLLNSAWFVTPEKGLHSASYDKMHLVPFGEYGSILNWVPGLAKRVLGIADFEAGTEAVVFPWAKTRRFGTVICFESCFPGIFRKFLRRGVDWMVVITNDAWYKLSTGARRHQTQTIFRAIESRRPIIRVANTGISCIVDAWGRTIVETELREGQPSHAIAPLPIRSLKARQTRSLYMGRYGDWFIWSCAAYMIVVFYLMWAAVERL